MRIDNKRLERQQKVIDRWVKAGRKGTLEAVTGFGKTFVGLLILQDLNENLHGGTAIVVVPTVNLKDQWEKQINDLGIVNTSVLVINTAVRFRMECDLLILDEVHNYTSDIFRNIFDNVKYRHILGLTATLERDDARHFIVEQYAPVIDTVTLKEAVASGYVSKFSVINIGLRMSEQEEIAYKKITDAYYKHFAVFNNKFNTAMRCIQDPIFRSIYVKSMAGWDDNQILNSARAWNKAMQTRKTMLYNSETKQNAAKKLISTYDVPIITFGESVDFAIALNKKTQPYSEAYHSKLNKAARYSILKRFSDPRTDLRILHTARALDEGFDVDGIEMAIICSGTSTPRQDLQRTGRAIRFKENKTGYIINIYLKDTQDAVWLKARQTKTTNVVWVHSVEDAIDHIGDNLLKDPLPFKD